MSRNHCESRTQMIAKSRRSRILGFLVAVVLSLSIATTNEALARGTRTTHSRRTPSASIHVRGYTKKSGKIVSPHRRTNPNRTKRDNWSTKGNVNPYTGKEGTKSPE